MTEVNEIEELLNVFDENQVSLIQLLKDFKVHMRMALECRSEASLDECVHRLKGFSSLMGLKNISRLIDKHPNYNSTVWDYYLDRLDAVMQNYIELCEIRCMSKNYH